MLATAIFKRHPEDFQVKEKLSFEPEGEGEHLFVLVRRESMTTAEVLRRIAKAAKVQQRNVSFSGTKDKHAVIDQWFSIWLPGKEFDWTELEQVQLTVLQATRHRKKLKRGSHKYNNFTITLREVDGDQAVIEQRLIDIRDKGFENRFGPQRFGIDNSNLKRADSITHINELGRQERSFTLSAIRSKLFNEVLERRLQKFGNLKLQEGDIAMFSDGNTQFLVDTLDETIVMRERADEIVSSGPLWGLGGSSAVGVIEGLEKSVAAKFGHYCSLLDQAKMVSDRRALMVYIRSFTWQWCDDNLQLQFELPKSAYATSLLAAVFNLNEERKH